MVLSHQARKDGGGRFALPPSLRLPTFLYLVASLGLIAIVAVVALTPWASLPSSVLLLQTLFLALAAIAGEVRPIMLPGQNFEERTLSTSAPFVLALVALAGTGAAVVVQIIASIADDVRHRRPLQKSLFNTSQYALSVVAASAVYTGLTGRHFLAAPGEVTPRDLMYLLIAGIAMIAVNWLLVGGVVAIATSYPLATVLRQDSRDFLVTNVVLLSVGGIAALVAVDGVPALLLLMAPVIAAHMFAAAAARHAHDATHDSLTSLGNRGQLHYTLERALQDAAQAKSDGPGLILLDLDHFKDINDALGHPVGDRILVEVARRLSEAASENATVHRLGGDEFAVVLDGGLADTKQVAHDLIGCFDKPVTVENLELLVRASVGVAVAPDHGATSAELMKNADIALYQAKVERDRISTYSADLDVNSVERLQILADLRTALDNREMHLVYQPQFDLDEGCIRGVEALIRWDHPERGLVPPDSFVGLAENSGLIFPLTAYVLDSALAQLAQWRRDGHQLRLAVNLSARHLSDLALPDQVWEIAARHGVPLTSLVLEVTETGILSDPVRADVVIRSLRELGVEISIDDYGTGNASLNYLKRLEIDELKIDRSFVSNLLTDEHDRIIVHSTIELALNLGLRVVAEGIEDQETTDLLRHHGGVIGQGFHLGRPLSVADMTAKLEADARGGGDSVPARALGKKANAARPGTASKAVS